MTSRDPEFQLVSAVCHETGNLMAALRLEAHLLHRSPGSQDLPQVADRIDAVCERTGAWMELIPALTRSDDNLEWVAPGAVLRALHPGRGPWGAAIEVGAADGVPQVRAHPETLRALLQNLCLASAELVPDGSVRVACAAEGSWVRFCVSDDGPEDPPAEDPGSYKLRGRPLAGAVAGALVGRFSGHVQTLRDGAVTRVVLALPRQDR